MVRAAIAISAGYCRALQCISRGMFIPFLAAAIALQALPDASAPDTSAPDKSAPDAAAPAPAPVTSLDELPIAEATAPRCAIAFALVGQWQKAADPRGSAWPDMETGGGREFFVQAMAELMDARALDRTALLDVVARETERLQAAGDDRITGMMPGCLMIKQAAGL